MTTVTVNSDGSFSPTYNRSGTTIVSVTASPSSGGGPVGNDGTIIPVATGHTIALVNAFNDSGVIRDVVTLPAGVEIGDSVEVYIQSAAGDVGTISVFPPVGESIFPHAASTGTNSEGDPAESPIAGAVALGIGRLFRKTGASIWQILGGES